MPFQTSVNTQPAPAVAGDFAAHDRSSARSVLAGPGGLVAGPGGVTVGRFCWITSSPADPDGSPSIASSAGSGQVAGIVHREQQALITAFLGESTMVVPQGFPITVMRGGDFWIKNEGTTQAVPGQFAYAAFANGAANFAAAGSPGTASVTGTIAAVSLTVTGYISNNILTVTGSGASPLVAGAVLSGTSGLGNVATGTQIVSQLSGSIGAVGTYAVSIPEQTVGAAGSGAIITATYGILSAVSALTGTIGVGGSVGGTGVVAGTTVTQLGTGTGGIGTYYVNATQTQSSTAYTIGNNVVTKWIAMSSALPGELVKVTEEPLG